MSSLSRSTKLGIWVFIILLLIIFSSKVLSGPFGTIELPELKFTSNFIFNFEETSDLSKIVQKNLEGKTGDYAVYIEDPTTEEKYGFREEEKFPSASLYKLFLLTAGLKEVEEGNFKLEDKISSTKAHLTNIYGDVDFGYEDAPSTIVFTLDEIFTRIGRISDNFASIMLTDKLGLDKVQSAADEVGALRTVIRSPIETTASDIGLFFKKLYNKEIISQQVSERIIKYLSLNNLNNRLPSKLPRDDQNQPKGWEVVHKTGELSRVRHDAGFVAIKDDVGNIVGTYVIVLLSQNLEDEEEGIETLANISKDVFEYFKEKKLSKVEPER